MSARIISTVGRAIDVIVAGRVVSHLRFAAGVCVLAAGLLMGSAGGAVAVADPDSSGSAAHGDAGTNASGQQLPPARTARRKTARTQAREARTQGDKKARHGTKATRKTARTPAAFHRREKPEERAWRHGHQRTTRKTRASPLRFPMWSAPVATAVAPVPTAVAPVPDVVAPVPTAVAPVPTAVAPVPDRRSRRFPIVRRAGSRRRRRRFPMWSRRFLTSSRRFRTCSHRLPVRSSRRRNCSPTFPLSRWASRGWSQ